jgi:hypothetical protein
MRNTLKFSKPWDHDKLLDEESVTFTDNDKGVIIHKRKIVHGADLSHVHGWAEFGSSYQLSRGEIIELAQWLNTRSHK